MRILLATVALGWALSGAALAADAPKINDAHIAHIAYTAGQIDIDAAKQALTKTQSASVRSFANQMVADHTAVNDTALALVKKLNLTPEQNPTSTALSDGAKKKRTEYAKLNGAAFDRAYVENEVVYHKTVNDALRNTLIPNAKNTELKSLLETGLKLFQEHQIHAEMLAATLGKSAERPK